MPGQDNHESLRGQVDEVLRLLKSIEEMQLRLMTLQLSQWDTAKAQVERNEANVKEFLALYRRALFRIKLGGVVFVFACSLIVAITAFATLR